MALAPTEPQPTRFIKPADVAHAMPDGVTVSDFRCGGRADFFFNLGQPYFPSGTIGLGDFDLNDSTLAPSASIFYTFEPGAFHRLSPDSSFSTTVVPVPPALGLFASGLLVLLLRSRAPGLRSVTSGTDFIFCARYTQFRLGPRSPE